VSISSKNVHRCEAGHGIDLVWCLELSEVTRSDLLLELRAVEGKRFVFQRPYDYQPVHFMSSVQLYLND
jgi:hypothetical protein